MKETLRRNLGYIVLFEIFVVLMLLYTFGITNVLLPYSLNLYASNFIYSALGVIVMVGPLAMRKRSRRLYVGAVLMVFINVAVEMVSIFPKPVQDSIVPLSNTGDVFDIISGLLGVMAVWIVYEISLRRHSVAQIKKPSN